MALPIIEERVVQTPLGLCLRDPACAGEDNCQQESPETPRSHSWRPIECQIVVGSDLQSLLIVQVYTGLTGDYRPGRHAVIL